MKYWFTALILITTATLCYGQESKRMAVVETSTCYMRIAPDYESALETQELMGTVVEIVGESGYWREIMSPQPFKAWTTEKTLVEMTAEQIKEYEEAPKYMFVELYGHIHMEPSEKSQTICDLVGGDVMRVVLNAGKEVTKGRWAQVTLPSGQTGWVQKDAVKTLGDRVDIKMGNTSDQLVTDEKMEAIIASAEQLLGVPYFWGGMSAKGVDCSGLVRISAIMNDVLLPRNASQMIKCGKPVGMTYDQVFEDQNYRIVFMTEFIEEMKGRVKNLERGDLVFFGTPATDEKPMRVTHVGIYLGNNRIIHSSHKVKINSLIPSDKDYYENAHRLIGATRL